MNVGFGSKSVIIVLIVVIAIMGIFLYQYQLDNSSIKNALGRANENIEEANDTIRDAKSWGRDRTDEEGQALNGLKEVETVQMP